MLEIKDLHIGYKGKSIQEGISFSFQEGSLIAITGRNGTGKSTFINTLAGFIPSLGGKVNWKGANLLQMSTRDRAKVLSIVQTGTPQWTTLTVAEVIALGAYPSPMAPDSSAVKQLLNQFQLEKEANSPLHSVSDGERQKTMIARALLQDTPILVLDEPTAFLDYESKKEWWVHLHSLKKQNKIVLISTHDIDLLEKQEIDGKIEF